MKAKVISTSDGSKTLELDGGVETYHSRHGALQESRHVFIKMGLEHLANKESVTIFEMGLGTGLNAVLTAAWAEENHKEIAYTSIEANPLRSEIVKELDYVSLIGEKWSSQIDKIQLCPWEERIRISDVFSILKLNGKLESSLIKGPFDIIYYDAFGPKYQPELWTIEVMEKMSALQNSGGLFITYCAQGQFRRNLVSVGYELESLPGPPGKREMTRGVKS